MAQKRYPDENLWRALATKFMDFSNKHGPPELLMKLALGRVDSCPFESESIEKLKGETIAVLEEHGLRMERNPVDRSDIPIDYRYMWNSC